MTKDKEFKIKFGGKTHQVNVNTFVASLANTVTIAEQVSEDFNTSKSIELLLKTLEPGSFIAGIKVKEVGNDQSHLLDAQTDDVAEAVIRRLAELNEYKKFIGNKPGTFVRESKSEVVIENSDGEQKVFQRRTHELYIGNEIVSDAISNNYSVLENDPSVESFELLDADNQPLFYAGRDEFDDMSVQTSATKQDTQTKTETANLRVHKIVFDKKYKWEFWYRSNKISANVLDDSFFESIDRSERFGKGDVLKVELQTNLVFDQSVDIFVVDSYQVNRVIEHTPKEKARQLELGD